MIENLNQYKTQGVILKSKAKWYDEEKKAQNISSTSKFFLQNFKYV